MEREILWKTRGVVTVLLVVGVLVMVACQAIQADLDSDVSSVATVTVTVTPTAFALSSSGLLPTSTLRVLMCDCILTQMPTPFSPDEYWATATVTPAVTPTPASH